VCCICFVWGGGWANDTVVVLRVCLPRCSIQVRCYALAMRITPSQASLEWRDKAQQLCHGGMTDLSEAPTAAAAEEINRHAAHILIGSVCVCVCVCVCVSVCVSVCV
jgi:hypothetical protein